MSDVIISKDQKGGAYHEEFCPYVKRIKKKNRKYISVGKAIDRGYCECKFCHSTRGLVYYYKTETDKNISYDKQDDAFCIKTQAGFWKLIWRENKQEWHVFHMNHGCFDSSLPPKKLMRGSFHRQSDYKYAFTITDAIRYIESHDRNYAIAEDDIRQMKRKTKGQRRNYIRQKRRKTREAVRNVYKIFDELEKERASNE